MRILMTGAAGFLGVGMVEALAPKHTLRLMDVVPFETPHERVVGDVCDLEAVRQAVQGMDAVVIGHMAPRHPGVYDVPTLPFDINVKGTAHLFHAATEAKVSRVVLISSIGVVVRHQKAGTFLRRDLPPATDSVYALTKSLQESIAAHYHHLARLPVAMLRPAYITDEDRMVDKYGRHLESVNWQFIDRRDIGDAVDAALCLPDLGCEVFYVLGHPDADGRADMTATRERLGWTPKHDFTNHPRD